MGGNGSFALGTTQSEAGRRWKTIMLKGVAKYGDDGKKLFEIHTTDHKGLGAHYHPWKDGHPLDAKPLTIELKKLLNDAINLK